MHTTQNISILERLSLLGIFLRLLFVILASVLLSPILKRFKGKGLKRGVVDLTTRFLLDHFSIRQMQWSTGASLDIYTKWAKGRGITPTIETLEGTGKLVWLTEKRTDRVLLYVHGGAFVVGALDPALSFCTRIREEVLRQDDVKDFGVVALIYSLIPETFPTQLSELNNALTHLLSSGLKQENIILLGDSAGGNLIMQFMVHTLHPFDGVAISPLTRVPELKESSSAETVEDFRLLGGLCLLSPWLSLDTSIASYNENADYDILSRQSLLTWGSAYLQNVSASHLPWVKPVICAPISETPWLAGLNEYVERVLITAGGKENLLDDSRGLYNMLKDSSGVELDVQEDGVHCDPFLDVLAPQGGMLSDATMKIVKWLGEGFRAM